MRAVLQRVSHASVAVDGDVIGQIGAGLLVFLGVAPGDGERELDWLSKKVAGLRIFSDAEGKMNLGLLDTSSEVLVVSQFTLFADCKKGRRPSFQRAAPPDLAHRMYDRFCDNMRGLGCKVATGRFAADMKVSLLNDGPITIIVDTPSP